ncbi:MAG TPA: hypothetical protein VI299_21710 [Polyangiales bacterium]
MRVIRALTCLALATAIAACDEDKRVVNLDDYDGGDWPDSGTKPRPGDAGKDGGDASGGDAAPGDAGPVPGPMVQLQGVTPVTDPLLGSVLTGATVDVKCAIAQQPNGTPIDPSKVFAKIFGSQEQAYEQKPLVLQSDGVYGATLSLENVPTGPVRVVCSASDTNMVLPQTTISEIATYFDGGPKITFTKPIAGSAVPRGTDDKVDFSIEFTVDPVPLAAQDTQSAVSNVQLKVRDKPVTFTVTPEGKYTAGIDFKTFAPNSEITMLDITVIAANSRVPTHAVATKSITVNVDGNKPTISNINPPSDTIVGGSVTVTMTISDDLSGVAEGVYATISLDGKDTDYPLQHDGSTYSFKFEATSYPDKSNIPINIYAFDNVGNLLKQPYAVKFDTVPPYVTLVNQYVRGHQSNTVNYSGRFPLLGNSPQDGETIYSDVRVRAFVQERGIVVPGAKQTWIAGVRPGSVVLYAQADANAPLLYDNDGDGFCDSVDETPTTGAPPVKHQFNPVDVGGTPPPTDTDNLMLDPVVLGNPIGGPTPPPNKCDSEMPYTVPQYTADRPPPPGIYARAPTPASQPVGCTGTSFDLGTAAGWTCLVVAASDNTGTQGNLGLSVPIRVCRELHPNGPRDCPDGALPPPGLTCMRNCTMPSTSTSRPASISIFEF